MLWIGVGLTGLYWALLALTLHLSTNGRTDERTLRLIGLLSQPKIEILVNYVMRSLQNCIMYYNKGRISCDVMQVNSGETSAVL